MCTRILPCNYELGSGGLCVYVQMWASVFVWCFQLMDDAFFKPLSSSGPVHHEKALFKKVWATACLLILMRAGSLLCICLCLSVCQCSFSLNHSSSEITEKNIFHGPWECVLCLPFIFPPFPPSGHNGFCVSLLKSSRIWTFSWHLLLKKSTNKNGWLIESSQHFMMKSQCDSPGLKTIMRTRALNKWVLMKCSHQLDNTYLCVLHPGCSVQVCGGSQRNLHPYLAVTAIFTTKRARNEDRHIEGQRNRNKL